jgi:hypothetical protein
MSDTLLLDPNQILRMYRFMEWITLFIGFILGLVSFFFTSIVWDRYDRNVSQPIRELQSLTRRIVSALDMHSLWLAAPAFVPTDGTPINAPGHRVASHELRMLSTELSGLISILPERPTIGKTIKDQLTFPWRALKYSLATKEMPPLVDLRQASVILMGLSNGFYLPANVREDRSSQAEHNMDEAERIKKRLGLNKAT